MPVDLYVLVVPRALGKLIVSIHRKLINHGFVSHSLSLSLTHTQLTLSLSLSLSYHRSAAASGMKLGASMENLEGSGVASSNYPTLGEHGTCVCQLNT